jgi:hypothetical protein
VAVARKHLPLAKAVSPNNSSLTTIHRPLSTEHYPQPSLMPVLRLLENDSEAATAKREPLLHSAGNSYSCPISWNSELIAVYPHPPGAIIDLENSCAQRSE